MCSLCVCVCGCVCVCVCVCVGVCVYMSVSCSMHGVDHMYTYTLFGGVVIRAKTNILNAKEWNIWLRNE